MSILAQTLRLFLALFLLCSISSSFASPLEIAERDPNLTADAEPDSWYYDNTKRDTGDWYYEYKRTYFPDYPPSCQICKQNYDNIDSCANASVVFANISEILYSPLSFFEVIQCACADTFQSAYPQCVDCFEQTNQTAFLEPSNGANLSTIVTNIRSICALGSAVFGGVASANSQLPGQTPITVATAGAALRRAGNVFAGLGTAGVIGASIIVSVGMGVWTVL